MKNGDLPAMPIELSGFGQFAPESHAGFTKREMISAMALQGILSNSNGKCNVPTGYAVFMADLLLSKLEIDK